MHKMTEEFNVENLYISVTHEFLEQLNPEWDLKNNNHLLAALYAVGMNVSEKWEVMSDMLVRYPHKPSECRVTTIYQGKIRDNYMFASMYRNKEVLDFNPTNKKQQVSIEQLLKFHNNETKQLVTDLPYEEPVELNDDRQRYMNKRDKQKYKIVNKNNEELEVLMQKQELFESPFLNIEED